MKTAIIYASRHHGNTKKLLKAMAEKREITLICAEGNELPDLSEFDRIGYASGIDFGKFYDSVVQAAEKTMCAEKSVFFLCTCGSPSRDFSLPLQETAKKRGCKVLGSFSCKGYDTYGPWKLIGGINKTHPDEDDVARACTFYDELKKNES